MPRGAFLQLGKHCATKPNARKKPNDEPGAESHFVRGCATRFRLYTRTISLLLAVSQDDIQLNKSEEENEGRRRMKTDC